jgi:hypothetical protein
MKQQPITRAVRRIVREEIEAFLRETIEMSPKGPDAEEREFGDIRDADGNVIGRVVRLGGGGKTGAGNLVVGRISKTINTPVDAPAVKEARRKPISVEDEAEAIGQLSLPIGDPDGGEISREEFDARLKELKRQAARKELQAAFDRAGNVKDGIA